MCEMSLLGGYVAMSPTTRDTEDGLDTNLLESEEEVFSYEDIRHGGCECG